jgi:hypothetical protein
MQKTRSGDRSRRDTWNNGEGSQAYAAREKTPLSAGSFRKRTLEKRILRTEDFHTGDLR